MNPFDSKYIEEYTQRYFNSSVSNARNHSSVIRHFGKCWKMCGGNIPESWGEYVRTRKASKNATSDTKYLEQGKTKVQSYLYWLQRVHPEAYSLVQDVSDRVSVTKPTDDIDFDDLANWLMSQKDFIKAQRSAAVESIVKLADNPDSAEFVGAVKCVKDYDVTLTRFANLLVLVQMYKEA